MGSRIHLSAVALAVGLLVQTAQAAPVFQWAGPGGNWSAGGSWVGGTTPLAGGDPGATLIFGDVSSSINFDNDLAGSFSLHRVVFDNNSSLQGTLRNRNGSGLSFTGAGASIDITGKGNYAISDQSGTALGTVLDGNLTINAMSQGGLSITSVLSGSGGLTINGAEGFFGNSRVQIGTGSTTSNTFSGGVTLNSGQLVLNGAGPVSSPSAPIGTGALTINGGYLSSASTSSRISNTVVLNADLRFITGTQNFNGAITAASDATGISNFSGTMFINNAVDIRGVTQIGVDNSSYLPNAGIATLTLGGSGSGGLTKGTLLNTSAVRVIDGGALTLDNASSTGGNLADRLNDAASIYLGSGTLSLRSASAGSSETVGAVTISGVSTLESQGGSAGAGVLSLASLSRAEHSVLLVRGANLGNTAVTNHGEIRLLGGALPTLVGGGGAAGTSRQSIVPWAAAYAGTSTTAGPNTLATFDGATNSFRALASSEYSSSLTSGADSNVRLSAATTNNDGVSVNALVIEASTSLALSGTGTVSIGSGTLVASSGGTSTIANNLDFGTAEAFITSSGNLVVSGQLTGSKGLTKSGSGSLVLSGDNSGLTGQLTLNGANNANGSRVDITAANNLPGTGTIVINGADTTGAAGIGVNGTVTVSRDIRIDAGMAALTTLNGVSSATFSGTISGTGSVAVNASGSQGLVTLSGQNTYTGATRIGAGTVLLSSDANLGNGGQLILTTATETQGLQLANDWTTSRQVNVITLSGMQTAGHNATLNGELLGAGNLSKFGAGALLLNGGGNYNGKLTVYEGALIVNSDLRTSNVAVSGGALGGTGAVGDVVLNGVLAPGSFAAPQGRLSMDTLAMTAGSVIAFDLGAGGDSIGITGAMTRNGATAGAFSFLFTTLDGLQAGQSFDVIDFGSTTLSAADFTFASSNAALDGSFSIVGNSLMFNVTAVPEPSPQLLLLAGLGALGWLARRRRR